MFDQLSKYVPTEEEVALLHENEDEFERMAKADRFMFDISSIDHFQQRIVKRVHLNYYLLKRILNYPRITVFFKKIHSDLIGFYNYQYLLN